MESVVRMNGWRQGLSGVGGFLWDVQWLDRPYFFFVYGWVYIRSNNLGRSDLSWREDFFFVD